MLRVIATVESPLTDAATAPKQAHEGAPEAWLHFDPAVLDALDGLQPGDEIVVLTWLDRADREVLSVHPRGDPANPIQGVFNTRSPARPNPIGLHEVRILELDGARMRSARSRRSTARRSSTSSRSCGPPGCDATRAHRQGVDPSTLRSGLQMTRTLPVATPDPSDETPQVLAPARRYKPVWRATRTRASSSTSDWRPPA